jgi:hypothetical protein
MHIRFSRVSMQMLSHAVFQHHKWEAPVKLAIVVINNKHKQADSPQYNYASPTHPTLRSRSG